MRVLPPFLWEGAGGIKGSTFSQNSSLTIHGFVRAMRSYCPLGVANRASLQGFYPTSYLSFRTRKIAAPLARKDGSHRMHRATKESVSSHTERVTLL